MIEITADLPGGNIVVESAADGKFFVRPDLRDTEGPWFYWRFDLCRREANAAESAEILFTRPNCLSVRGPAVRFADGPWDWLEGYDPASDAFTVTLPAGVERASLCTAIPCLPDDFDAVCANLRAAPQLSACPMSVETLCRSRRGREAPLLRLGRPGSPLRVILTSRHHCCEMIATHALLGFVCAFAGVETLPAGGESATQASAGRAADLAWMRERVELIVVPFVDYDGVVDGDQGKNRRPHDHNRDYLDEPLYPETRSLMALVRRLPPDGASLALDLHCPWIRGQWNEHIYMVGSYDPVQWRRQNDFARLLEAAVTGPLPYAAAGNLPHGESWNTRAAGLTSSCSRWMGVQPQVHMATPVEIPYAEVRGMAVTAERARAFGVDLAVAAARYLQGIR